MGTNKAKSTQDYYPMCKDIQVTQIYTLLLAVLAAVISACTMKTLRFPSPWQLLVCQE